MPLTADQDIADLLRTAKTIAMVGASDRPDRPSHGVMRFLLSRGYDVIPVNPQLAGQRIHDRPVVATLAEIHEPIDIVDIFRNSTAAGPVIDDAVAAGAKAVWTQLGVFNDDAVARAESAGLKAVVNRCPAIEIPRLGL
ncbi:MULTISPECIES: CoA-binding protein [unclassified Sphingomonas]|uniref:CoA-binding protein n=1 Tax=unclassified Sphingomonas TaxID=196159 RepID=UPI0006F5A819|nr:MULTISPECIES: CoA-binding protein [unclassified Sphingomonas]KQX20804.1 CoA-binding protein [Sphingomonas sp. Root1294]KQY68650.1 CoA-binding protein [Sphingomonas sp. Root50]KRB88056.1 CoA-binding protein [Sphingomonas sp. Root720]